jgi:trans-2,3-dihydro-3-hydroxyanthranilate isomerase
MKLNKSYRYRVVDVFTTEPLEGNPLAVFPDASDLSTPLMQKIAREFNLSETVFVFPATLAECAAKLRIFTPGKEMDFAGHPTVGTAYILLDERKVLPGAAQFVVEENVGPISISVESGAAAKIWLKTPALREGAFVDKSIAAALLGLNVSQLLDKPPQLLDAGNPTLFIPLADRETVDAIAFDTSAWKQFKLAHPDPLCVFVFTPTPEGAYSRMFAPDYGIAEDPATGSSTGPLAAYMMKHSLCSSQADAQFYSEQGTWIGRRSILHVHLHGKNGVDGIAVGGNVTPVLEGALSL